MLRIIEKPFIQSGIRTCSVDFKTPYKSDITAEGMYDINTIPKYDEPSLITSSLREKSPMTSREKTEHRIVNINPMDSAEQAAIPKIFAMVFLSPFPQYWLISTDAPETMPKMKS